MEQNPSISLTEMDAETDYPGHWKELSNFLVNFLVGIWLPQDLLFKKNKIYYA